MAAFNTEIILARTLGAGDDAYALIREALTPAGTSSPATSAARPARPAVRTPAYPGPRRALRAAQHRRPCYPGTRLTLHYEIKPDTT